MKKKEDLDCMLTTFIIAIILIIICIAIGIFVGVTVNNNAYFVQASDDSERIKQIGFYIKKHTIFRRFAFLYSIVHYVLNILSIIVTLINVYMVVDTTLIKEIQIIFLLLAAILPNLVITLHFDKIGGCYAQAMRILENAILKYLSDQEEVVQSLIEANAKAEQLIQDGFF